MNTRAFAKASTAGALLFAVYLVNRRLGRRWGATQAEVKTRLPGDDLIPEPAWRSTHAVTIRATAEEIWPWLVQMGFGRAGWYTSEWFDHLVWRVRNPSVDRIVPELQHLAVGDIVPDSSNQSAFFRVEAIEPDRAIVYRSIRHPVTGRPPDLDSPDPGPYLDFTWVFALEPAGDGETRLLLRARATVQPRSLLLLLPLVDLADCLSTLQILRGIKRRVEREAARRTAPRPETLPGGNAVATGTSTALAAVGRG